MSKRKYKQVGARGLRFVFKYDDDALDLLHIYARHLTTPDEVLDLFFDPSASQVHDGEHDRFERSNGTHTMFWFWLKRDEAVMVITCFKEDPNESA